MVFNSAYAECPYLNLRHCAKIFTFHYCPRAAVFCINPEFFTGGRLYAVKRAFYKMIFRLDSAVNVAIAVIIRCAEAKNKTFTVPEFFRQAVYIAFRRHFRRIRFLVPKKTPRRAIFARFKKIAQRIVKPFYRKNRIFRYFNNA